MIQIRHHKLTFKVFQVLLVSVLFWGLLTSWGWAKNDYSQVTLESTIPVTNALATTPAQSAKPPSSTTAPKDFLSQGPLTTPPVATNHSQVAEEISIMSVKGSERQCSSTGNLLDGNGSENCIQRSPDGSSSETHRVIESSLDESKEQMFKWRYGPDGNPLEETTVRIKIDSRLNNAGEKLATRKFYDVVIQPRPGSGQSGLITRDFVIIENNHITGEVEKITSAHYVEFDTGKAGLTNHSVIYYKNGTFVAGFNSQYKNGKIVETRSYDLAQSPNLNLEKTEVVQWAHNIAQLIHQSSSTL